MPIIWRVRLIFDRALPETLCDRVYDDTGAGKDCPVRTDFFLFLKYHFHLIGKDSKLHKNQVIPALVFSTAYALSGFVAAYSWDIMWMDCILLFPLIMVGLENWYGSRNRDCIL